MTKLPDNDTLRRFFREGLSDKEIAQAYGCSIQAVNLRFTKIGIERKPFANMAVAILEAAWPRNEFDRTKFGRFNRARDLAVFIRSRLGDPTLTGKQQVRVERFTAHLERNGLILALDWSQENPWVFMPREPSDGRLVIRWPEERELPKGAHLEAISLPPSPAESGTGTGIDA